MEEIKIHIEKVDDAPLLIHLESSMGISTIIDKVIKPHGNREEFVLLQVKMDFKKADMDNKTTKKGTNHVRKSQKKI